MTSNEIIIPLGTDQLLTIPQAAKRLQVSDAWIRSHANGHRKPILPSIKLGKSVRISENDLLGFITNAKRGK